VAQRWDTMVHHWHDLVLTTKAPLALVGSVVAVVGWMCQRLVDPAVVLEKVFASSVGVVKAAVESAKS